MERERDKYNGLFNKPLEEIKEDLFFRPDNIKDEWWYDDLMMFRALGVCKPEKEAVVNLQKALKVLGYDTESKELNGMLFLVPLHGQEKKKTVRKMEQVR